MPNIPRDTGLDSTWAFLRDPYRFISTRSKFHQSPVFQTRLILQKTLCLTGAEAARLICDPDRFVRQNAAPKRLQKPYSDKTVSKVWTVMRIVTERPSSWECSHPRTCRN
jgi:hypothetical protein